MSRMLSPQERDDKRNDNSHMLKQIRGKDAKPAPWNLDRDGDTSRVENKEDAT